MAKAQVSLSAQGYNEYRDLPRKLRKAGSKGKDLRKKLRTNLNEAGKPVVEEVRTTVRNLPVTSRGGGGLRRQQFTAFRAEESARRRGKDTAKAIERGMRGEHGLRASIARATKLQITARGIRIVVSSAALPPSQQSLPRHLDSPKGWRHPRFGDKEHWYHQQGKPYFASVIKKHAPKFRKAAQDAINEITRELER